MAEFEWAWKPGAFPSFSESQTVNTRIEEAIRLRSEALFDAWLADNGLTDFRKMPPSEDRTRMKHKTFALLDGGEGGEPKPKYPTLSTDSS